MGTRDVLKGFKGKVKIAPRLNFNTGHQTLQEPDLFPNRGLEDQLGFREWIPELMDLSGTVV